MNKLFITASAFSAINDRSDTNHTKAVEFVHGLFSETVKLYTSQGEVVRAAQKIQETVGRNKMISFMKYLNDGDIIVLPEEPDLLEGAFEVFTDYTKDDIPGFYNTYLATLIKNKGIMHVLSFDDELRQFSLLLWP